MAKPKTDEEIIAKKAQKGDRRIVARSKRKGATAPLKTLIEKAQGGDLKALNKLAEYIRIYFKGVVRPYRYNRENKEKIETYDGEDTVGEACYNAIKSIEQFKGQTEKTFKSWLGKILTNTRNKVARDAIRLTKGDEIFGLALTGLSVQDIKMAVPGPRERIVKCLDCRKVWIAKVSKRGYSCDCGGPFLCGDKPTVREVDEFHWRDKLRILSRVTEGARSDDYDDGDQGEKIKIWETGKDESRYQPDFEFWRLRERTIFFDALKKIPQKIRTTFILFYFYGLSNKEIAGLSKKPCALGCCSYYQDDFDLKEETVKVRLHKARKNLGRLLPEWKSLLESKKNVLEKEIYWYLNERYYYKPFTNAEKIRYKKYTWMRIERGKRKKYIPIIKNTKYDLIPRHASWVPNYLFLEMEDLKRDWGGYYPFGFIAPSYGELRQLKKGDRVKLSTAQGFNVWAVLMSVDDRKLMGCIETKLPFFQHLNGNKISFGYDNIFKIRPREKC